MLELIQNVLDTKMLDAVDMSSDQTSSSQSVEGITCYAIQYYWTGFNSDSTATISTQASNGGGIWTNVDSFIPTGSTGSTIVNVEKAGYKFIRVVYDQTAGTGALTAHASGKVI